MFCFVFRVFERIFVTPDDRNSFFDIRNKTKAEIKHIIVNLLKVRMALVEFTTIEYLLHGFTTLLVPCILYAYYHI